MALQVVCGLCSDTFSVSDRIYSNSTSKCGHIFHENCTQSQKDGTDGTSSTVCPSPACAETCDAKSRMERNYAVEAILKLLQDIEGQEEPSASRKRSPTSSTFQDTSLPMSQNAAKRKKRPEENSTSTIPSLQISRVAGDAATTEDDIADRAEAILNDGTEDEISPEEAEENRKAFEKEEESRKEAWFSRSIDEYGAPPHSQYVRSSYAR